MGTASLSIGPSMRDDGSTRDTNARTTPTFLLYLSHCIRLLHGRVASNAPAPVCLLIAKAHKMQK